MFNLFLSSQRDVFLEERVSNLLDQEVVVVNDVEPGRPGQALWAGVYWRCRTTGNTPILAGQRARVLGRESTTLWVLPI